MPAPSPVFVSQPQAPRCSRLSSTWIPCRTMSCDLRPLRLATKPTPQESCSYRGSYNPCFGGVVISLMPGNWYQASLRYSKGHQLFVDGLINHAQDCQQ